jgi:hypothetical protein
VLEETEAPGRLVGVYFRMFSPPRNDTPAETERKLLASAGAKVDQRRSEGLAGYHISVDECESRLLGGRAALRCIATYTQGGQEMREYLMWIQSNGASALITSFLPPSERSGHLPTTAMTFRELLTPLAQWSH